MTAAQAPLRRSVRLRLCFWCAGAVVAEIGLYLSYRGHDARFHWFTHFFVGASTAMVVMTGFTIRTRRPVPYPLVWPLAAHVYAMAPDLLFAAGRAHQAWMDVFLGHVSSHYLPGRNLAWYAVFLASLAAYLVAVDRARAADVGRARPA